MIFYLGTHQPQWLDRAGVPLFVSHRRLRDRKTLPTATARWALDSGGFTEVSQRGYYLDGPRAYVAAVRRYVSEIGLLDFAAPQDFMCEPLVLRRTGLTVPRHQWRTVTSLLDLRTTDASLPFIPVLQGWHPDDYLRCAEMYERAGIRLADEPTVGVGSVCRRQATREVSAIFARLAPLGLRLHGFGVKRQGLARYEHHLASADSMAWSFTARRAAPLPGCVGHKNCANCLSYALRWREETLRRAA